MQSLKSEGSPVSTPAHPIPPPPPFKCQRGPSGQRKANIPVAGQKSSLRLFVEGLRCLCKLENYTTNWINSETLEWQHMFICVYMRLGLAWGSCPPWVTSHLDDTSFADVADDRATFFFSFPLNQELTMDCHKKWMNIVKYWSIILIQTAWHQMQWLCFSKMINNMY